MGVQVVVIGPHRETFFSQLQEEAAAIEAEVGEPLTWLANPEKQESHIRLFRDGVDLVDESTWDELIPWVRVRLERLYDAFARRVRQLSTE